jgi:hypothetical protein
MTIACPACHRPMTAETLDGHLGVAVTVDICLDCQAFWFDDKENLQLTPASTLRLFRVIGERARQARAAFPSLCKCPRCDMRLAPVHDQQRATRFEYLRCPVRHGRLISFFDFLREKNFITPLSPDQVEALKRNVQFLNCSNCGAPMDLSKSTNCAHCGSPLSMLDMKQAAKLIEELKEDPRVSRRLGLLDAAFLPMQLERARRETAATFDAFDHSPSWYDDVSSSSLLGAGLTAVMRWLK